jgi:hypothetical protein
MDLLKRSKGITKITADNVYQDGNKREPSPMDKWWR